ncbi:unnamed protein product [Kuraishia capsulata CBS 1993]|uniref:Transcription initiation factor IIE subunit beta n=1 Tax=Kuraishia capsulata CBS 1993 TaxID=1382522 RepID=W6MHZ1_9ASCO|nr:uncharacterized protein KUCA_T00001646001 [Kuraishia capsulata CBS 1993]CDK25676.1 unnamed protein product [Kuraishia capsulata CBS 1993]
MTDSFSAQINAFKKSLKTSSSTLPSARRVVEPVVQPKVETQPSPVKPQPIKRDLDEDNYAENSIAKRSKPTLQLAGSLLSTQLLHAVEYIKQHDNPIPLSSLERYLSYDVAQNLLPLLKNVNRIKYDPNLKTLEYVSLHNIRSSADLLGFLRAQPTFKGISVKDLRDGWPSCLASIDELEADNKILVLRTKKENAPRLVWPNYGGKLNVIDEEFVAMWNRIKIPEGDDLQLQLVENKLKPTSVDPSSIRRKPAANQDKKQKRPRRGKITNTHMKGILKDYSSRV